MSFQCVLEFICKSGKAHCSIVAATRDRARSKSNSCIMSHHTFCHLSAHARLHPVLCLDHCTRFVYIFSLGGVFLLLYNQTASSTNSSWLAQYAAVGSRTILLAQGRP